jgi:hypothetical protein
LNLELSGAVRVFRPVDASGTSWERSSGIYILPLVTASGYSSHYRPRHNLDSARCWAELFLFVFLALACSPGLTFCRGRKSRVHLQAGRTCGTMASWHCLRCSLSSSPIEPFCCFRLGSIRTIRVPQTKRPSFWQTALFTSTAESRRSYLFPPCLRRISVGAAFTLRDVQPISG